MVKEWLTTENGESTLADAMEAEKLLGVKLPEDFIQIAMKHGGSVALPHALDIPDYGEFVFNFLVSFNTLSEYYYIIDFQKAEGLPAELIAIADDGLGNLYCYDYRETNVNPSIVLWEHEIETTEYPFVAENLTTILDNLHEFED